MARRKTKYHIRKDGLIETTKTFHGIRRHFYGHSDDEVEAKIAEYQRQLDAPPVPPVRTLEAVAGAWWEETEPTLSPNTITGYRTAMRRAVEEFGSAPVTEITPQRIYAYLKRFEVQGYSQKVINNSKSVLHLILNHAFIAGEIAANPCKDLPPVKGRPKVPRQPTPADDIQRIEASKTESLPARMTYFMLYTGCRRGEAAALQQKYIDLDKKTARICQAVAYSDTRKPILKAPKSEAGYRDVDLYDNVIEILPHYDDPETYIFFPDGLPTKTQLEKGLREYQADHGITSTAHQLRHAYASLLHSANVDVKDAQVKLGHSTVAMTQDVYTHLEDARKVEIRDKVNRHIQERKS